MGAPQVTLRGSLGRGSLSYSAAETGQGRDLRLDFLRGFAVLAMVVDHVGGPSPLHALTGGNRFYTSAAEGFVFLSGLVLGLVYHRTIVKDGLAVALKRLVQRAWALYVIAVALTLLVLPISEVLQLPWARGVDLSQPFLLLWRIVTLQQTTYLVDVPLLYALLLFLAPIALLLLSQGQAAILVVASGLLWAGYQFFPEQTVLPWPIAGNYLFQFPAWQLLFFVGMAIGFHTKEVEAAFARVSRPLLLVLTGIGFALLIGFSLNAAGYLQNLSVSLGVLPDARPLWIGDVEDILFSKGDLRPGRILASAVVFAFLFLLVTQFWRPLRAALGWLLIPLGQSALAAYSVHVLIALGFGAFAALTHTAFLDSPLGSAAIQLTGLALVWLLIRTRIALPNSRNRAVWMAAPLPLAAALFLVAPNTPVPNPLTPEVPLAQMDVAAARSVRRFGTPIPRERAEAIARLSESGPAAPTRVASPDSTPIAGAPIPETPLSPSEQLTGAPARPNAYNLPADVVDAVGTINGTLREATFFSPSLLQEQSYYIYLPPTYASEPRRLPVLYMLHGIGGHRAEWVYYGIVGTLDRMITSGEIPPMLLVLPQGDTSYWVNQPDGGPRWSDYVSDDLITHIDATYPTLPDPGHRAIGGLSNGARAALRIGFLHPTTFGVVGAHSPSLQVDDGTNPILGTGTAFEANDPMEIVTRAPGIRSLSIWLDIGEEDPWLGRALQLHNLMDLYGIQHVWSTSEGGHESDYWETNLPRYLRFYSAALTP